MCHVSHVTCHVSHFACCMSPVYSSGRNNDTHKLLQYGLLGVDWVTVRWCPHRSGIIREPPEVWAELDVRATLVACKSMPARVRELLGDELNEGGFILCHQVF